MILTPEAAKFMPDVVLYDPDTLLPVNIPAMCMEYPWWWELEPKKYEYILAVREANDIAVDDWLGKKRPVPNTKEGKK